MSTRRCLQFMSSDAFPFCLQSHAVESDTTCPQVRRLIFTCLSKLYTHGDMISIYARVSGLQSAMTAKDAATRTEVSLCLAGCPDLCHGTRLAWWGYHCWRGRAREHCGKTHVCLLIIQCNTVWPAAAVLMSHCPTTVPAPSIEQCTCSADYRDLSWLVLF